MAAGVWVGECAPVADCGRLLSARSGVFRRKLPWEVFAHPRHMETRVIEWRDRVRAILAGLRNGTYRSVEEALGNPSLRTAQSCGLRVRAAAAGDPDPVLHSGVESPCACACEAPRRDGRGDHARCNSARGQACGCGPGGAHTGGILLTGEADRRIMFRKDGIHQWG